jgi:neutral amino acid transport system substrate-binding protein
LGGAAVPTLVTAKTLTEGPQPGIPARSDSRKPSERRVIRYLGVGCLLLVAAPGCEAGSSEDQGERIVIGASLPFTGKEAALGRNIEQAMLLALEDVNQAGGIDGVPLALKSSDSNSGSERGLNDLLDLVYNQSITVLVGPEENDLASEIVPDVKKLNVLNVLPGFAAPSIERSTRTGAWLRLAPTAFETACALAAHAADDGAVSANALASQEDYNATLKANFVTFFSAFGGTSVPSVPISSGQSSYRSSLSRVASYGAERTLLVAYPATAANIVTEWAVTDNQTHWYLSPLLRTEAFLLNIPDGALNGQFGLSPSRSLASECGAYGPGQHGNVRCTRGNTEAFAAHFAERWQGATPFSAASFYYDAVVIIAAGMQYGMSKNGKLPDAKALQKITLSLNKPSHAPGSWNKLDAMFRALSKGTEVRYVGAAAEYGFDEFGAAKHQLYDTWTIRGQQFEDTGTYFAHCIPHN